MFVAFLVIAYFENIMFYRVVGDFFNNQPLAMLMLFVHNTLAISLILLGMTFYVNLVLLNFFKREKYSDILLQHPRIFAAVFTVVVLFISILRVGGLTYGEIDISYLPQILLISAPIGILEGYGIYLTISKTLSRTISAKDLVLIYSIFLVAAVIEVGFINLLASAAGF